MIETLMHGKSNILTIAAANALFKVLNTKLFVTKTAGELISGERAFWFETLDK